VTYYAARVRELGYAALEQRYAALGGAGSAGGAQTG
jgi:hypothetical protein